MRHPSDTSRIDNSAKKQMLNKLAIDSCHVGLSSLVAAVAALRFELATLEESNDTNPNELLILHAMKEAASQLEMEAYTLVSRRARG